MSRHFWAIHIEGVGNADGSTAADGVLWVSDGAAELTASQVSSLGFDLDSDLSGIDRSTLAYGSASGPSSTGVRNEPFGNRLDAMGVDFPLRAIDGVAERLLYVQPRAQTSLTAAIDDDDTDIVLDDDSLGGTVVWIGHEAILLGSWDGDSYPSSTRAYYTPDTNGQHHEAGANVYTDIPRWEGRRVRLYSYDLDNSTLNLEMRYRLSSDAEQSIEQDGPTVILPCEGPLAGRDRWAVNTDPLLLYPDWKDGVRHTFEVRNSETTTVKGGVGGRATRVRKIKNWASNNNTAYYRIGDALYEYDGGVQGLNALGSPKYDASDLDPDDGWQPWEGVARECLVIGRQHAGRSSTDPLTSHPSDLSDIFPYHPLAIDAAVCLSTRGEATSANVFDIFQAPHWGLDLRWLFEGDIISRVRTLIEETPQYQIDHLVLGWDGQPIEWMAWSERHLLSPFGFTRALTDDGKLTYARVDIGAVDDYDDALSNTVAALSGQGEQEPGPLAFSTGRGNTEDEIAVTFDDLPWTDPQRQLVSADTGDSSRLAAQTKVSAPELNLGVLSSESATTSTAVARLLLQHFAMPRLRIRVANHRDDGLSYDLGDRVTLDDLPLLDAWLIDSDGDRIATLNTDVRFMGQIYGRTPEWGSGQLTYLLDILLTNFSHGVIRWRGPAAEIFEIDNVNNYLWVDGGSLFGLVLEDDGEQFTAGDEIAVWDQNGVIHETTYPEITGITQTTSPSGDGDEWRLELDGWFSADPSAGQIVRLAPVTQYSNTGILTNIDRVWAYIADNTATPQLGNGDDADVYG